MFKKRDFFIIIAALVIGIILIRQNRPDYEFSFEDRLAIQFGASVYKYQELPVQSPQSVFPLVVTSSSYLINKFDRLDKLTDSSTRIWATNPATKVDWPLTIFWVWLPIILLFLAARRSSFLPDQGDAGFISYSRISLAVIAAVMIIGIISFQISSRFFGLGGIIASGIIGTLTGFYAGRYVARLRPSGWEKALAIVLASTFSGGIVGATGQYYLVYIGYLFAYGFACYIAAIYQRVLTLRRQNQPLAF